PTPVQAYASAGEKAPKILRLKDDQQVIVCPRCHGYMPVDANICRSCGIPFTMEGAAAVVETTSAGNGMAAAALAVGILSLPLFMCFPLGIVAIVLGALGVTRAEKLGPSRKGRNMAIAG